MIVIVALLCDLLLEEICVERTWFYWGSTGYINVFSRSHDHSKVSPEGVSVFDSDMLLHSLTGDVGAEDRAEAALVTVDSGVCKMPLVGSPTCSEPQM